MQTGEESFNVDLTACPIDSLPAVEPTAVIAVDPRVAGAWTVAGDLDGDGKVELVQARLWERDDTHAVASVSAYRVDGSVLWHWGNPGDGVAALHSDAPCQIHDWNRDGRAEVVVATRTHVVVLDGATGTELWRFATPDPDAADCLVFARLSGGQRDDILLKDRYHRIWAYTGEGRLSWAATDPGGMRTAHQPYPVDLDGDGRDAIVAGYAVLGPDGGLLWALDKKAFHLGQGHLDCVRVLQDGPRPEDWRLVLTCCGDNALLCLDGRGNLIWRRRGLHFESIDIARFVPGSASRQLVVDIDHAEPGRSPLHVLDGEGRLLGELNSVYGRHHRLVRWADAEVDRIVMCEDRLLVSGQTGEPLCRLHTPIPAGVCFDQSARPQEHRNRGEFHLLGRVGNLFGTGAQDLMLTTNPGGVIWLYRNPGPALSDRPLGTGRNATLY
jgi:hypothetical protein